MLELTFTLVVFTGWILSVCLHEFGHAVVAYFGGDISVKDKGYLTLNPLKYTNPTLSFTMPLIFLLLGGIPLPGAAVYINKSLLRNRVWDSAVSAAGPAATLIVAVLLAMGLKATGWIGLTPATDNTAADPFALDIGLRWLPLAVAFLLTLEVAALVLNLIPLPGLDGYGILEPWLPPSVRIRMKKVKRYGFIALFAAFWLLPAFNGLFWGLVNQIVLLLGIPPESGLVGYSLFRKGAEWILIGLIGVLIIVNQLKRGQPKVSAPQSMPTEAELDHLLKDLDETLTVLPNDYEALLQKSRILFTRHQYDEALTLIHRATQSKPKAFQAWYFKGLMEFEQQQYKAAIATFTQALKLQPKQANVAYNLACCYAHLGDTASSLQALTQALKLDPTLTTQAQTDSDLDGLRSNLAFQSLITSPKTP